MTGEIIIERATTDDVNDILEIEKSVIGTKIYSGLAGKEDTVQELSENVFYLIKKDFVIQDVPHFLIIN